MVRPLGTLQARPAPLPTGLPALDKLLGGLPRGALTVLAGGPSSGAAGIALRILAGAQQAGKMPAYVDASQSFDPAAARQAGLDLKALFLARPPALQDALSLTYDLLCEGSTGLVLLDSGSLPLPDAGLRLLANAVARGSAPLLCLTDAQSCVAQADLRLNACQLGWETAGGDAFALRTRVTIEAGRGLRPGQFADLLLPVDEAPPCWSAS